jgi:hypothetical protein
MIVNNSGAVGQSGSGQRGPNETRNRPDEYTVPLSHYPIVLPSHRPTECPRRESNSHGIAPAGF